MEMNGASENNNNGENMTGVVCSICLELVIQGGVRSTAKLQCGHEFHLDCIGSAFNMKGMMQCPYCREIEEGEWLYARGPTTHTSALAPEAEAEAAIDEAAIEVDLPFFYGFPDMMPPPFGPQICPFQAFTQALMQDDPSPMSSFGLMNSMNSMGGSLLQQLSGNIPQHPGGNLQHPSGNIPQHPSGNLQHPSGNIPQHPGGNLQHPGGNIPQHPGGNIPQHPGGNIPQQPGGNIPQHPSGNIPQQLGGNIPQQPGGNIPQHRGWFPFNNPPFHHQSLARGMHMHVPVPMPVPMPVPVPMPMPRPTGNIARRLEALRSMPGFLPPRQFNESSSGSSQNGENPPPHMDQDQPPSS